MSRVGRIALVLLGAACGPAVAPNPEMNLPNRCTEARARIGEMRQVLDAGKLLRALEPLEIDGSICPVERQQLAAMALQAAASLGDAEAVRRWAPALAPDAMPAMFSPDGPVAPLSGAPDAAEAYRRAVAAYQAGEWVEAGKLGLAVGAAGSALAAEGFILAARSAERGGDAPRAARMWARAYRVACGAESPCVVQPPREDLFTVASHLGRFVPNASWQPLCFRGLSDPTVVNKTWYLTPSKRGGYDLRELRSRTLIERVEVPEKSDLVCFSLDGRSRLAYVDSSIRVSKRGGPWVAMPFPSRGGLSPTTTMVTDDGLAVVWRLKESGFTLLDPSRNMRREVPAPPGTTYSWASPGPGPVLYVQAIVEKEKTKQIHLIRHDTSTGLQAEVWVSEAGTPPGPSSHIIPQAIGDQIAFEYGSGMTTRYIQLDGRSGRVLNDLDITTLHVAFVGHAGGPQFVWRDWVIKDVTRELSRYGTLDISTGKMESVEVLPIPPNGSVNGPNRFGRLEQDDIPRVSGDLPTGSSPPVLAEVPGFSAAQSQLGSPHEIDVKATNRPMLRVFITADKKGALVIEEDGRFELIGQISPTFRLSASCGDKLEQNRDAPAVTDRVYPLEVCAAALERPGIVASWSRGADILPVHAERGGTTAARSDRGNP